MASVDFPSQLADAAVALLTARKAEFLAALGTDSSGDPYVEYSRSGEERNLKGLFGRCSIYIEESQGFEPSIQFPDSALSTWSLIFRFDLIESRDLPKAKSRVLQAVQSIFGDGGIAYFAQLVDSGSNRLGASGTAVLGQVIEVPGEQRGTANAQVQALVEVSCWHKLPMTHTV